MLNSVTQDAVRAPGRALAEKFVRLGVLGGKTRSQIYQAVGPPSSISQLSGGKSLIQWIAPGYHIALQFDGEICEGITHEFSS